MRFSQILVFGDELKPRDDQAGTSKPLCREADAQTILSDVRRHMCYNTVCWYSRFYYWASYVTVLLVMGY